MGRHFSLVLGLLGAVALATGACTSSSNNHNAQQDGGQEDAPHQFDVGQHDVGVPDAPITCTGNGFTAAVETGPTDSANMSFEYVGDSTNSEPYDSLTIELYYGSTYADPLKGPGTVTIGQKTEDKNYKTCTTCVRLRKNCTAASGCTKVYLATEGTLTITAMATGGNFTGTLTNVKLQEVTIASDYTSTPVANGTWWCLDTYSFDVVIDGSLPCTTSDDCVNAVDRPLCDTANSACVECITNAECASKPTGQQLCGGGMCGACSTALDCASPTAPLCEANATTGRPECVAGGTCTGDDAAEPGDDGPNGARLLTVGVGTTGNVCIATDGNEYDFYKIVTSAAGNITVTLSWADTAADLDFLVFDSTLTEINSGETSNNPEIVALTSQPAGTYYVAVFAYDMGTATNAIPYTVTYTTP